MPPPDKLTDVQPLPPEGAAGDLDDLLPVIYSELHALAEAVLQRSRKVDSTRTTSLINEVYLRLAQRGMRFRDRAHFLGLAARAMRSVLVDRVRRAGAAKRGGGRTTVTLDDALVPADDAPDLLALHEALLRLSEFDQRKSRIVELRFFGGLSVEEAAEVLALSPATVKREWTVAKAWLLKELEG